MVRYSANNARRSVFHTIGYRALSQMTTVLGYVVLVRALSEPDFGVYNLLYAFVPVVGTIASFGLEQTLRRFQPEFLKTGDEAASAWLVRTVGWWRLGVNIVALASILLAWSIVAPIFKLTPHYTEFLYFCLLILVTYQNQILQLALAAHMLHRYSVGSVALVSAAKLAIYGVLAIVDRLTLTNAIIADLAASAVALGWLARAHHRHCRPPSSAEPAKPNADYRRRMIRYGLFNSFNDAGTLMLNSRSDNFFLAALLNAIAVGTYSFYVRLNDMIAQLLPMRLFENVIQPLFFAIKSDQAEQRLPQFFSLLINANLLWQLPAIAYTSVYHAEIVTVLFGGKFLDDSWLLPMIVGFATLNVVATPVTLVAQYEEKASIILLSKIFAVYNVVMLLLLIPLIGVAGAVVSTGTAQILKNLFIWWHVRDTARWQNCRAVFVMAILIWGGAAAACFLVKFASDLPALGDLILGVCVCGLAWLAYARSPAVSSSDRQTIAHVLRGRESRALRWLGLLPSTPLAP